MWYDCPRGTTLIASTEHRFTFDCVSQLDRDASTALATLREWRNSFVPINRVPTEVLSLIVTHISNFTKDIFRASAVCRHWRRILLQHAALWSLVDLTIRRCRVPVKTILERARGSALDIITARLDRADVLALLSSRAQQFRTLEFIHSYWSDIQRFSEAVSGPLPLLRTLKIRAAVLDLFGFRVMEPPPSLPLFSGAVNLKNFILLPEGAPFLNHFAFPNLTTFELSSTSVDEDFPASQLLNFLEASPTLQVVRIKIEADIFLGDIPPERVVVLPNVETLSVTQDVPGYWVAAHTSYPSTRLTSLVYEHHSSDVLPQEVFPTSVSWNAIGPQYMASKINEVVLKMTTRGNILSCSLSFVSPGPTALELVYKITGYMDHQGTPFSIGEKHSEVLSQAFETIQKHPLLSKVQRLHIRDRHVYLFPYQFAPIAKKAAELFKFMGPLEELILDVDDLPPFLSPFFDLPGLQGLVRPDSFPSFKGLTVIEHLEKPLDEECVDAIVGFAKSQHTRGVPFERATFGVEFPPVGMAERLEPWVGAVNFCEEMMVGDEEDPM